MVLFSCKICLSEWSDSEALRSLSCGHGFCGACIQRLLTRPRPVCPTCREGPIESSHIRPVFIDVEPGEPLPRENAQASRRRSSAMSIELLPRLFDFITSLQTLTPESGMDVHAAADELLEILASERCNEAVKNVLLGALATFLDINAASAYEAVRGARAATSPPGSSRTYQEIIDALRRELRDIHNDLRVDNRALAKRGQELGEQLVSARAELERVNEEMRRTREQQRRLQELAYGRWGELEDKKLEVERLKGELKQAREKARVNEAKYRTLNTDVNGAIKTLSRSSETSNETLPRSRSNRHSMHTMSNARKSSGFF